jgi:ubiquinone/menaquinone biosynthesis C-methylase UbiE
MNCDLLARPYQALECIAFGRTLEKQRFAFLHETDHARRALILGEGDGRFVCELATRNGAIAVDCIEASAKMIEVAQRRLHSARVDHPERIRFLHCDAMEGIEGTERYDLVVTHFFLDCFSDAQTRALVRAVRSVCAPAAKWLIAEFRQPDRGWRKWHARCWLDTMYLFFGITTGLQATRLPDYRAALKAAGFELRDIRLAYAQMIGSELWQLHQNFGAEPD